MNMENDEWRTHRVAEAGCTSGQQLDPDHEKVVEALHRSFANNQGYVDQKQEMKPSSLRNCYE